MGAPSSSALPPGALGTLGSQSMDRNEPKGGAWGEAHPVAGSSRGAKRTARQAPAKASEGQEGLRGPGGPPQRQQPRPHPAPARALLWGHRQVPLSLGRLLRETGMLTKRSFGDGWIHTAWSIQSTGRHVSALNRNERSSHEKPRGGNERGGQREEATAHCVTAAQ